MAEAKRKAVPAPKASRARPTAPNGVTPKRGPGPKGGIPKGQDKMLRVSGETHQGLYRVAGDLCPSYGREVSVGEAMAVVAEKFRKVLSTKAGRAAVVAKAGELPQKRIALGEEEVVHVTSATYAVVVEIMGILMSALGRKVTFGEATAIAVEYALDEIGRGVSA